MRNIVGITIYTSGPGSFELVKLLTLTLFCQFVLFAGFPKIEAFLALDSAFKDREIREVTSRSVHQLLPPAFDLQRETALLRLRHFQVRLFSRHRNSI